VEFDKIYAVSHPGRAEMWQFGLFCGSNGYCKSCMYPKCPDLILSQGKQIYYVRLAWMTAC
jgi:hypothetical protein